MKPRTPKTPPSSADLMELLLLGWEDAGQFSTFEPWEYSETELRQFWRTNQVAIRAEARRRGLATIWAEAYYDINPPPWLRGDSTQ